MAFFENNLGLFLVFEKKKIWLDVGFLTEFRVIFEFWKKWLDGVLRFLQWKSLENAAIVIQKRIDITKIFYEK